MMELALAFGAGLALAVSPCTFPMLPLVLGASAAPAGPDGRTDRLRPLLIVLGFVLSFVFATMLFAASTRVLGISHDALRPVAVGVLLVSGALLIWLALLARVTTRLAGLSKAAQWMCNCAGSGPGGALMFGASLGLLWMPCTSPVLASMLALVATEQQPTQAASLLVLYALGAGVPMLAVAYGGQAVVARTRGLARRGGAIRRVFGVVLIATAAALHWQPALNAAMA